MRRHLPLVLLVSLLTVSACSSGSPEYQTPPLELPDEVVPNYVNPIDMDQIFPADGTCRIAKGAGVRVLQVIDGTGADGLLHPGDILVSIDDVPTPTREILIDQLEDRPVGAVVEIDATRSGEPIEVSILMSPAPGAPGRSLLGVITETNLESIGPEGLLEGSGSVDNVRARPVVVNDLIFRYDPLGADWVPYPGDPADRIVGLDSELYTVAESAPLSLMKPGEEAPIPILPGPVDYQAGGVSFQLVALTFEEVIGSVGDLLLVAGVASAGPDNVAFALHAVDPVSSAVVWIRPTGLSDTSSPLLAADAFRSPSGEQALVELVEYDLLTDTRSELWNYYLVNEAGEGTVGPPGIDQFFPTKGVSGWFDEDSLIYLIDLDVPQVAQWSILTGEHEFLMAYTAEQVIGLRTVVPVGDGEHVVEVRDSEVVLVDANRPEVSRLISRGCDHTPL
ncbi:MAG: hypothetical protein OXH95_05950 [bacterium]|nr:hypothetical protein [bacterium]MCY3652879.1 hypothetical protein [bacterium]MDE0643665.1 hypothetical protein [bacterium]